MKKLLIIPITIFMLACNDSDNSGNDPNIFADTSWKLIKEEGYEIDNGQRYEWSEKSADFNAEYVFRQDNTGEYIVEEEGIASTAAIKWSYNSTDKVLTVDFIRAGDVAIYNVESMSSSSMVLVIDKMLKEQNYEFHNKQTYTKK